MKEYRFDTAYLSALTMELSLILQAGIPLSEGTEMLAEGDDHPLHRVAQSLDQGDPLYLALASAGGFPQYMIDMIQVGEETGNLDRGLRSLSTHYHRQQQLESSIRRAVLYPALLLLMMTAVLVVLIVEVLPMFQDVYAQLGGTLTGLGGLILDFGILLRTHWLIAIFVTALIILSAAFFVHKAQVDGGRILLSKKLGLAVATAKLASALAMAIQSGLDTDHAMALAQSLTQHPQLKEKLHRCGDLMVEGESLASALGQQSVFSPLHCRMLMVGMRTGAMDQVMEDIAGRCDADAQQSIDRYVSSVEPTLVMVMSILVGVVLLSVMLPLAGIMTALG